MTETRSTNSIINLDGRRVKHPAYRLTSNRLAELLEESNECYGEIECPGAYVFTAESRLGKTTIVKDFVEQHPAWTEDTPYGQKLRAPVVVIRIPPACTLKEYIKRICIELGVDIGDRPNRPYLIQKVLQGFKECGTRIFITDEINIVLASRGTREITHIRDFVKELIDLSGIPIVFFGLPSSMNFFKSDVQTDLRVEEYIELPKFSAPTHKKSSAYRTVLKYTEYLSMDCGITLSDEIDVLDLSQRFYLESGGRIGGIKKIFVNTAKFLIRNDISVAELSHFKESTRNSQRSSTLYKPESAFGLTAKEVSGLIKKHPTPHMDHSSNG